MCWGNEVNRVKRAAAKMVTFRNNMQMVTFRNNRRWTGLIQQRIKDQVGVKRDGCNCDERQSENNECRLREGRGWVQ